MPGAWVRKQNVPDRVKDCVGRIFVHTARCVYVWPQGRWVYVHVTVWHVWTS